jgi:hypothetical protein
MSHLKIYSFEDLAFQPHTVIPGGKQARLSFEDGTNVSVIGGNMGCYGNGDTTFEVWYSDEENPRGWQSHEDINKEFSLRSMPWRGMI